MSEARSRAPRRPPLATVPAVLIAVVLVACGVLGVHDLASARGWTSDGAWVAGALRDLDGTRATWWTTALGVVLALLGVLLVVTGFGRGRVTHRRTPIDVQVDRDGGEVWISNRALARFAQGAAERTTGVVSAGARVRRRRLVVHARTLETDGVSERLQENLARTVGGFTQSRIVVRAKVAKDAL